MQEIFSFISMFCWSLFVLLYFCFWPLCCLFEPFYPYWILFHNKHLNRVLLKHQILPHHQDFYGHTINQFCIVLKRNNDCFKTGVLACPAFKLNIYFLLLKDCKSRCCKFRWINNTDVVRTSLIFWQCRRSLVLLVCFVDRCCQNSGGSGQIRSIGMYGACWYLAILRNVLTWDKSTMYLNTIWFSNLTPLKHCFIDLFN
jgi:hypothetical protein